MPLILNSAVRKPLTQVTASDIVICDVPLHLNIDIAKVQSVLLKI